jgi:hypothetical protein
VPGGVRSGHCHVHPSEEDQQDRRAGKHHQESASDQQVTSGSIVRPRSVGLVTEM